MAVIELPSPTPEGAWDDAAADQLNAELAVLAGQLNLVHARLSELTAHALETGLWAQGAVKTPEQFLCWKIGVSHQHATELVRVAEHRDEFPVVCDAFDQGEISLEQTAQAVRAPAWADDQIIDIVRISTVAKLQRSMRSRSFDGPPAEDSDQDEADPDEVDSDDAAPEPAPENTVTFGPTDDGRWRLRGEFDLLTGQRIQAALEERRDALFTDGNPDTTWAEALVDCCERSLDLVAETSPTRTDRYRTWIHLDTDAGPTTTDGWRIPMALADRILCDGILQPVWESDGVPFSVGRAQRIVPDRTRRIVERRDQGCRVPGCTARHVEIHHIIHWLDHGPTDTWNLISLCPHHHRLHHQGKLGISGNADEPDGIEFTDARGSPIEPAGQAVPPNGPPPTAAVPYRPPLRGAIRRQGEWIHPDQLKRRAQAARNLIDRRNAA